MAHPDPHVLACVTRIAGLLCSCDRGLQLFSAAVPEVLEQLVLACRDSSERQRTAGFEALTRMCLHERGASHFFLNNDKIMAELLAPAFHDSSLYVRHESAVFLFALLGYASYEDRFEWQNLVDLKHDFQTNPDTHELLVLSVIELAALALTTSPETVTVEGRSSPVMAANVVLSRFCVLTQLLAALRVEACPRLSCVALDAVVDVLSVAMTSSIARPWVDKEGFCRQLVAVCFEHLTSPQARLGIRASAAVACMTKESRDVLGLFGTVHTTRASISPLLCATQNPQNLRMSFAGKLVEMLAAMCTLYPLLCAAICDFLPFLPDNLWIDAVLHSMEHLVEAVRGQGSGTMMSGGAVIGNGEVKEREESGDVTTLTLSQFARTRKRARAALDLDTQEKKVKTTCKDKCVVCGGEGMNDNLQQPSFVSSALIAVVRLLHAAHSCGMLREVREEVQLLLLSLVRIPACAVLLQSQVLKFLSEIGDPDNPGNYIFL